MTKASIVSLKLCVCALLLGVLSGGAYAQPLDDVGLEFQSLGVVATIRLTGPVQYLRHFPESHGKTLEIYYERVKDATSNDAWADDEVRKSPPSRLIPGFTVTTRDQQTKPKLVIEFSREAEFSVAAGKDNRSLLITIRPDRQQVSDETLPFLPTIKPEVKPAAGVILKPEEAAAAETNQAARALLVQGRDALAAKNNDAAVDAFNKLLLLPPNYYTQDGQEWIGVARERAGQPDKAKVEYDLYLRLYPEGAGAARVAQRLDGLSGTGSNGKLMTAGTEKKQAPTMMAFGSVSSRYYYGRSKIDTTNTFNGVTTTDSISLTDQSMLITSMDASERYRTENYDSRLVFRDVNSHSFLTTQTSQNRVSAAYGEIKGRTLNYLARVGRQTSMGGGVLGRFDGLTASYGDAQDLRVNTVAGALSDYSQGSKPKFVGASVDRGAFSFYGINQTLEGIQDRRAVGTEFRYFDDKRNAFGLLDYDTYFKAVNAAQFMGMTKGLSLIPNGTFSFMLDHRKTPSLSIRNALNGATTSSVTDLLQTISASSLRDLALARTATSNMGQIGITVPVREKWQVGGDFRLTNTTGMPASGQTLDPVTGLPTNLCTGAQTPQGCIQANPGPGLQKSVTGQIIGSGLYKQGDIWSGSVTLSNGSSANGHSFFVYNHTQVTSMWMMDTTLQWSGYKDQFGGTTTQFMPMLRGSYRFKERFTFDADGGYQKINYSGPVSNTKTTRLFCSAGLRWDF
jgi:tetratricopeptide (TPR) repeat protein